MPVFQTLEFNASPGLANTITAKLFALGADTIIASAVAIEKTNDKGRYVVVFTDVPAGRYRLNGFVGSTGGYAKETYRLLLLTAKFYPDSELIAQQNFEQPERDTRSTRPIEFYWEVPLATFPNGSSTRIFPGQAANLAQPLSGAITQVRPGLYSIAYNINDRAQNGTAIVATNVTYTLVDNNGNNGTLTLIIVESPTNGLAGDGSNPLVITVTNGSVAIAGAVVSAYLGGLLVAWGYTNGSGQITFSLASGTHSIEVQTQPGYVPQTPVVITLPGTTSVTLILTAQAIAPPTMPGLCTVRFFVLDNGCPAQGASVLVELEDRNPTVNTALVSRAIHRGRTNSQGISDLVMIQKASFTRGGTYKVIVTDSGGRKIHERRVTVPNQTTIFADALVDA